MNAQATHFAAADDALTIGAPCRLSGGEIGYIVAISESDNRTFTIGAGGLSRDYLRITVAAESGHVSELSENIVLPMIGRAIGIDPITANEAAALLAKAKIARDERRAKAQAEQQAAANGAAMAKNEVARLAPSWARASCSGAIGNIPNFGNLRNPYQGNLSKFRPERSRKAERALRPSCSQCARGPEPCLKHNSARAMRLSMKCQRRKRPAYCETSPGKSKRERI